ncbi:hypothetical protein EPD60_08715 [Flaviaesturariibacter flavus]|uniref:Uncharacterized protein n=1 Tax=Flaviaesturariibacter flavus TaxID=2502780 RepID=A0A4R1BAV5_9BACT|nr:hypothetical protein [Flaviaesturariibacter flavus]TCJ14084.1 hypothetical protein EPD60_08715 [Flaviaesturariibacter flavus]
MEKIFRVGNNPFNDRTISTPHLCDFGADAWPKLDQDFPQESAEIKRCVDKAVQGRSRVQQAGSERSTDTSVLDAFLDEVAVFMRKSQARVAVDLDEDSREFRMIYPNGRRTYSQLTKTDAPRRVACPEGNGGGHRRPSSRSYPTADAGFLR